MATQNSINGGLTAFDSGFKKNVGGIFYLTDTPGNYLLYISSITQIDYAACLYVDGQSVTNPISVFKAVASYSGDYLQFRDSSETVIQSFNSQGRVTRPFGLVQYTNGTLPAFGSSLVGSIVHNTTSNTIQFNTGSEWRTLLGEGATTAAINDSSDRRYVTDSQLTVISNTSGTNTGDETGSSIKTKVEALTGTNRIDASAIKNIAVDVMGLTLVNNPEVESNYLSFYNTVAGTSERVLLKEIGDTRRGRVQAGLQRLAMN